MDVLRFECVSKMYGDVKALRSVSFSVSEGVIHAVVGHNGAGKTTSLRIAVGLLRPDSGEVRLLGEDPFHSSRVREYVGYVGEDEGLLPSLTVLDNLVRFCVLRYGDLNFCRSESRRVIEEFGLIEVAHERPMGLSRGLRKRTSVARAFIGRPKLLILDEPTESMDLVNRRRFWRYLKGLVRSGATAVVSSHVLSEIEEWADSVTVLHEGMVVFNGSIDELRSRFGCSRLEDLYLSVVGCGK